MAQQPLFYFFNAPIEWNLLHPLISRASFFMNSYIFATTKNGPNQYWSGPLVGCSREEHLEEAERKRRGENAPPPSLETQ